MAKTVDLSLVCLPYDPLKFSLVSPTPITFETESLVTNSWRNLPTITNHFRVTSAPHVHPQNAGDLAALPCARRARRQLQRVDYEDSALGTMVNRLEMWDLIVEVNMVSVGFFLVDSSR